MKFESINFVFFLMVPLGNLSLYSYLYLFGFFLLSKPKIKKKDGITAELESSYLAFVLKIFADKVLLVTKSAMSPVLAMAWASCCAGSLVSAPRSCGPIRGEDCGHVTRAGS